MDNITAFINDAEQNLKSEFSRLEEIALFNQKKVLSAFSKNAIQARHMYGTTGYGYDDNGRDTLNQLFGDIFCAESALVSPLITSGTHALTLMLKSVLMPGDKLLSVTGSPYDTLLDAISGKNIGSLRDYNVSYQSIDLLTNGLTPEFDFESIENVLKTEKIKAVFITRSRGYSWRQALSISQIAEFATFLKKISPKTLILVDNCYGEFTQMQEPIEVGADLIAGSLIKNIGGGISPTGGYIVGKSDLVEQVAYRFISPSVGNEVGSNISGYLPYYQGLFLAPSVVKNALKGALLFAKCYSNLGFSTLPTDGLNPYDIVTSIKLDSADQVVDFCGAIQQISPIDSNVMPLPWDMPGYQHQVVMAAGTFVQGASIELSADSPIKEPYIVYVQGGLTYEHIKLAVEHTISKLNVFKSQDTKNLPNSDQKLFENAIFEKLN